MIQVENLTYDYPGKRALDNLSFTIEKCSITALIGPNGAGKTTLLKCLSALIPPFEGSIHMSGLDILKFPRTCHKTVGFLSDFFGLYDTLTVEQYLTYFALARKVQKNLVTQRVKQVTAQIRLMDKFTEKVGSLSRGMRQRLGLGQAMIHDPDVLLLDEPASGLDPESRIALAELFVTLNQQGKTLIVSSHILSELNQYATDLLILKEGRIVETSLSARDPAKVKKLCVNLLNIPDNIEDMITSAGFAAMPEISGNSLIFDFSGTDKDQSDLLKSLITAGFIVKEFYVKQEGVQEQYLKTIS